MRDPNKARRMVDEGRVRKVMDTQNRTHFSVEGDTDTHSVIYDKRKDEWTCDCRYSALTSRECSHIAAAKIKG